MGLWTDHVLPRVTDRALGTGDVASVRSEATSGLHGRIVEIGFGSGLNVAHYPVEVRRVEAVEPSFVALRLAVPRVAASPVEVSFSALDGQDLPFADDSFDGALSTFTLCTIPDVSAALREVHRVLKPGAALHFAEHGLSSNPRVALWQHRLDPTHQRVFGGCHLDRPIDQLVFVAGFEIEQLDHPTLAGSMVLKPWRYLYRGVARKLGGPTVPGP